MCNGISIKIIGGTETQVMEKKNDMTPGIQYLLVNLSYDTAKSMSDTDKLVSLRTCYIKMVITIANIRKHENQFVINISKTFSIKK